jgi:hypothetical protein
MNYIKIIYQFDDVEILKTINNNDKNYSYYLIKGYMGDITFHIYINGKGELACITSYPNDVNIEEGISQESARRESIEHIKKEVSFCDLDNLILKNEGITEEYYPMYFFEYEYRQNNPTVAKLDLAKKHLQKLKILMC